MAASFRRDDDSDAIAPQHPSEQDSMHRAPARGDAEGGPIPSALAGGEAKEVPVRPPRLPGATGTLLGGRYRVLEQLGESAAAGVFSCRDERAERRVAVKRLKRFLLGDKSAAVRITDDWKALIGLHHVNAIAPLDAFVDGDGSPCLVLEQSSGRTLAALLEDRGRLSWQEALPVGRQIAEALAYLHGHGCVHGDLKPGNVFVAEDLQAKIADFGLTLRMHGQENAAAEEWVGSPLYRAPEQFRGLPPSPATDIYAFGILLQQMITGEHPLLEPSATGLEKRANRPAPPLEHYELDGFLIASLQPLLDELLAEDPDARAVSLLEVSDRLRAIQDMLARPSQHQRALWLAQRRRPVVAAAPAAAPVAAPVTVTPPEDRAVSALAAPSGAFWRTRRGLTSAAAVVVGAMVLALWLALADTGRRGSEDSGTTAGQGGSAPLHVAATSALLADDDAGVLAAVSLRLPADVAELLDLSLLRAGRDRYVELQAERRGCTRDAGLVFGLSVAPERAALPPEMTFFAPFEADGLGDGAVAERFSELIAREPIEGGIAELDPARLVARAKAMGCAVLLALEIREYVVDINIVGDDRLAVSGKMSGVARVWDVEGQVAVVEVPAGFAAATTIAARRGDQERITGDILEFLRSRVLLRMAERAAQDLQASRPKLEGRV
ncbi:MAG: serine/threonine protein kinase [Candidatus Schekmanbacteria bacterium]|nr:serine/threonine protein kinase [Candidatus Schekmanbacteria bacterium]